MKTLGVIGGMGPAATVDFLNKLISLTQADTDQQHVPVLVDSNTSIPDRTAAILHGGEDPVPELCKSARRLERAGADILMMTCNTAHFFYDAVQAAVSVPVLHMPCETAKAARAAKVDTLALLSTTGTLQSGVYATAFAKQAPELRVLTPDLEGQSVLMSMIYEGVKAGKSSFDVNPVLSMLERLKAQGAQCFILGCTELPIAFSNYKISARTIDPGEALARAALIAAGASLKE